MMVIRMIWMIRTTKKTFRMEGYDDGVDEKTATSELQTGTGRSQKGCRPSVRENDHHRRSDDSVNLANDLVIKVKKMTITIMVINQFQQ